MPNGFGRGFGRGFGFGGGMGFGFRGSSPPWPFVGRGRGGLPRCGYFSSGVATAPAAWPYQQPPYHEPVPFAQQMTKEQEFAFLKNQAEAIKGELEQIEARMRDVESKE